MYWPLFTKVRIINHSREKIFIRCSQINKPVGNRDELDRSTFCASFRKILILISSVSRNYNYSINSWDGELGDWVWFWAVSQTSHVILCKCFKSGLWFLIPWFLSSWPEFQTCEVHTNPVNFHWNNKCIAVLKMSFQDVSIWLIRS